eukprot:TRINITY_DN67781_c0_g1_i1.p1 TRINITY_DN67781_c0_g1~~TRINITY_DN67781_c0_g1_i1.p1  ORF type:complete len:412 (-),score=49.18 TRINITY_DN67781_c0_g1_i1:25-1260(-)
MGLVALYLPFTVPVVRKGLQICLASGFSRYTCCGVYYLFSRLAAFCIFAFLCGLACDILKAYALLLSLDKKPSGLHAVNTKPDPDRMISPEKFEEGLENLERYIPHPEHGLLTISKDAQKLVRECVTMLGAGPCIVLQLAHPYVAFAIKDHSYTGNDVRKRFFQTFKYVFAATFGDWAASQKAARQVFRIHRGINGTIPLDIGLYQKGSTYNACNESAAIWVLATLVYYTVFTNELFVRDISAAEKEAFWRYTCKAAAVWGISATSLPATWQEFVTYCQAMFHSAALVPSPPGLEMVDFLLNFPLPWERPFGINTYRLVAAALTPRHVREQFGLYTGFKERAMVAIIAGTVKSCYRFVPGSVRYLTQYHVLRSREQGKGGQIGLICELARRVGDWFVLATLTQDPRSKKTN